MARTSYHIDQRRTTLRREIARYGARIVTLGSPTTAADRRRLTLARKVLRALMREWNALPPPHTKA